MYIDTHAHLTDGAFDDDRQELIKGLAAGGIGILTAAAAGGGVVRHHGVDVARAHEKGQTGTAEAAKILCPLRLGQHADAVALRLQHPGNDRGAEARVVNIGVAGDDHNVGGFPSPLPHFPGGDR